MTLPPNAAKEKELVMTVKTEEVTNPITKQFTDTWICWATRQLPGPPSMACDGNGEVSGPYMSVPLTRMWLARPEWQRTHMLSGTPSAASEWTHPLVCEAFMMHWNAIRPAFFSILYYFGWIDSISLGWLQMRSGDSKWGREGMR